jgi:glutamine cyclotransferase
MSRLDVPAHLLDEVVSRIEDEPAPGRWGRSMSLASAVAGGIFIAAIAIGIIYVPGLMPPGDARPSPTAQSSVEPSPSTFSPPPLDSLPPAGTIERVLTLSEPGVPSLYAFGSLWLASDPPGTLVRIDPTSGEVLATIDISDPADRPYNMAPAADDRWIWVSAGAEGAIVRVDPQTNRVADRFAVDAAGYQMISTGTDVYMTDFDRDLLVHIDAATGEIEDRIQLPGGPSGLAITDDGLWVSLWRQPRLLLLTPQTIQTIGEYEIELSSTAMAADGEILWIWGNNGRPLERFSIPERRVVVSSTEMGFALLEGEPWGITFAGELVRMDPETLVWTAGTEIDMRGCDCTNIVAGPERLYVGTVPGELIVVAP